MQSQIHKPDLLLYWRVTLIAAVPHWEYFLNEADAIAAAQTCSEYGAVTVMRPILTGDLIQIEVPGPRFRVFYNGREVR